MSESDKTPIDPFANVNLDAFKQEPAQKTLESNPKVDKEAIKMAAEKSEFSSRQAVPKKKKLVTKTFSLFQDEIIIINDALTAYRERSEEDLPTTSNSDAVRAGLHLLSEKTPEEQADLIALHRGRGRR